MKFRFTFLLLSVVAMMSSCNKIEDGSDVIHLMKKKYNNSYIKNFTFSQHVTEYENDSIVHKTVWHEAYSYPHNLIIKFENFDNGSGYVYNRDSLYIMNDHKIDSKMKKANDLIVMGFDVYEQPFEKTSNMLKEMGYDINKFFETEINGKEVYCIGAESETDSLHKFYIDKENLCLIKNVKYYESGIWETVLADYKEINGKTIATSVLFYFNGELSMTEEYYDIKFPDSLDSEIFNPYKFKEAKW